jgi:hypothetical protein
MPQHAECSEATLRVENGDLIRKGTHSPFVLQAYLKLKQQLEAKEEQLQALKGAAPALGDGEGGPDGAASKLERADQRLAELEAQLQKATLETDKVKSDAKKYVETLKKKEQVGGTHPSRLHLCPAHSFRLVTLKQMCGRSTGFYFDEIWLEIAGGSCSCTAGDGANA